MRTTRSRRLQLVRRCLLGAAAATLLTASLAAGQPLAESTRSASTVDLGCPSPPGAPHGKSLRLKVVRWCGLTAPHRQWQLKLQLRITNTGRRPLDVRLSHFWLAMTHFNPTAWHPPGRQPGEQPFKSAYE